MLTKADVVDAINRLLTVHRIPKHLPQGVGDLADVWLQILRPLRREALTAAVDEVLRSNAEYLPKPGELFTLARKLHTGATGVTGLLAEYLAWEGSGYRHPQRPDEVSDCPVCGAPPEWRPRYLVVHNIASHLRQGMPVIGEHDGHTPPAYVAAPAGEEQAA